MCFLTLYFYCSQLISALRQSCTIDRQTSVGFSKYINFESNLTFPALCGHYHWHCLNKDFAFYSVGPTQRLLQNYTFLTPALNKSFNMFFEVCCRRFVSLWFLSRMLYVHLSLTLYFLFFYHSQPIPALRHSCTIDLQLYFSGVYTEDLLQCLNAPVAPIS